MLLVTSGTPEEFRLARRTAVFKLASCYADRADRLLRLASEGRLLARTYAAPSTAKPALMAEAHFYAMQHDWRRAMSVCKHCNPVEWLPIAISLIKNLSREAKGGPFQTPRCEPVQEKQFKLLFSKEEKEQAAETVRRR